MIDENLNTLNNLLRNSLAGSTEEDPAQTDEESSKYIRRIGDYDRMYSFEAFLDNISRNEYTEIIHSVSEKTRVSFFSYFENVTTKLDFYKAFDKCWNILTEEKNKKAENILSTTSEKLGLINMAIKTSLRFNLEWLNVNGYIAKNIDNNTFNAMTQNAYNKLTDEFTSQVNQEVDRINENFNKNIAQLCCLAQDFYDTLDIESKPDC